MSAAPDPLAVIEEALHYVRAVMRGMMSDHAITERILLDPEIAQCDDALTALASLKREREERERLREALSKIAWRLTDENYPEHNSLGHDRAYYLKRPDAAYLARFRGVVKETLAIARAALDGEQEANTNVG